MLVNPQTTAGANFIAECKKSSRTPKIAIDVHYTTGTPGVYTHNLYGMSDIKSFNISASLCNNSEYSVGNVPTQEASCVIFNPDNIDRVTNAYAFEVFFTPFNMSMQDVFDSLGAFGERPSDNRVIRVGTYYVTNAYMVEGEKTINFNGLDAVGYHVNVYYPDNDGLTYPITARQLMNSALTVAGLKTLRNDESFINLDYITIKDQLSGYTVRQVLEMCCAFEGANLGHLNNYFFPGNDDYDLNVWPMYPGWYDFNSLQMKSIEYAWENDAAPISYLELIDQNIFSIKKANKPILYAGVSYGGTQYTGTGATVNSEYYLEIPQNEILNDMSSASLATAMDRLANRYKGWQYFPINASTTSVPFVQLLDRVYFVEQSNVHSFITSFNFSMMSSETLVSAGNTTAENDYKFYGSGTTRYDRSSAMLNRLYKFFYPSVSSLGVGQSAATANIPVNGRADFGLDVHFNARAYLGENQLKYTTHQYLVSSAELSSGGWYRIATWSIGASTTASGAAGILVDIAIASQYQATNNGLHKISLTGVYNNIAFANETSIANSANGITKIRYVTSTSGNGAIDVFYNLTTANNVRVDISAYFARAFAIEDFTPMGSTLPADETERATYTFSQNFNSVDLDYYKSGDTETFSTYMAVGGIYNSAKRFYFTITTPKRLDKISTVSVTTLKARVSGVGGLIESSSSTYDWTSGYTVTVTNTGKDYVTVRVDKSTALSGATVDTPVIVYLGTLTLSFS